MTDQDLAADIAFVKTLAQEGRNAPSVGGAHLATIGALTALAQCGHWAIGAFDLAPSTYWVLWGGFGAVFGLSLALLNRRVAKRAGVTAANNRAESAVWGGISIALSLFAVAAIARAALTGALEAVDWILPAALMLYGVGHMVGATMAQSGVLRAAALAAFASAAGAVWLVGDPRLYLFSAAALVVCAVLPGLILMAREPRTTV